MPAGWQASGTLLGSTGADITPVIPSHAIDDILMLMASSRVTTETLTTPSGWTLKHGPIDTTAWRTYCYWKRATSASETNPLLDWSAAIGEKYGQVHTVRGAIKLGDPFAGSVLSADVTDPIAATGVTTTLPNQRIGIVGIGSDNASTSASVTSTDPTVYSTNHFSTIATGADATGAFFSNLRVTAGATGGVTLDHNSTMPAYAAWVTAILDEIGFGWRRRREPAHRFLVMR